MLIRNNQSKIGWLRFLSTLILLLSSGLALAATQAKQTYTIGIAPQQAASELAKRWVPVINYWSEKTGANFQFRTSKDIDQFQKDIGAGVYDIMFVNAYHYTVYHQKAGYEAFAADLSASNYGILIIKADSAIKHINQLKDKGIAFPSPAAVVASWLPSQALFNAKVHFSPTYVKSMDSVYFGVAKGLFAAGGGEMRTFNSLNPEIKKDLHILWQSAPFPSHPFSSLPRVPKDVVIKLQQVMLDMSKNPEGMALLQAVSINKLNAVTDHEYDGVRKMNLKPLITK
jgi:phosphonate transport system substrate-binding protein